MVGYRTEDLYGEGYRDAASVMAYEVFQLENTDILDTLSDTILKGTESGKKMEKYQKKSIRMMYWIWILIIFLMKHSFMKKLVSNILLKYLNR